ncbi:MAG: DUF2062 domain-containing protein [Pyrinomonadaceae bacterium MAG19_C2-C3]|nr:DUF2062 domain-containing protein [Pyrinomonadaceae bacterium MAG19_C2-C3]
MLSKTLRRLLSLDDPPERTALAFAVGVFIAFSPFLGLHTIMATIIAFAFRFNKVAIYTGTFINNPFLTLVPIILASYAIGAFLTGQPIALPPDSLELLKHPRLTSGDYRHALWMNARLILVPFAIGGTLLSIVASLISYPLMLRVLRRNRSAPASGEQA